MSIALSLIRRPYVEFDFTRMAFDTRVSFSRSSDGTYFDAAGVMQTASSNVPRKEHNPATGAVRGLLVEEQRTNILPKSQEINDVSWAKSGATVSANSTVAPDGTMTADSIYESAITSQFAAVSTIVAKDANVPICFSVFAKDAGSGPLHVRAQSSAAQRAWCNFNLLSGVAGAVTNIGDYVATAAISALSGGWYKCALICSNSSAVLGVSGQIFLNSAVSYAGNPSKGAHVWGAQIEAGSYPTSYIPTTTAAVTRAADVASFTIPARVVRLVTIYDDGTTSQQTVTPGASYTIPTGQKPILRIRGYFA